MKFVIDGKDDRRRHFKPWLQDILDLVKAKCDKPIALMVNQTSPNSKLSYTLENRKAQLSAVISKVSGKDEITLSLYRRDLPDEALHILPEVRRILTLKYDISPGINTLFAELIVNDVCAQNDYWHGKVKRVKVDNTPSSQFPIYGGRIIHVLDTADGINVLTESGISHILVKHLAADKRIEKNRYLVMKSVEHYITVSAIDFQTYYQQV